MIPSCFCMLYESTKLNCSHVCLGGNADYPMDLHQKEQLHDNTISMMQQQHFSVNTNF